MTHTIIWWRCETVDCHGWIFENWAVCIECGAPNPVPERPCDHAESLWGRCARCGMTWEQQQTERESRMRHTIKAGEVSPNNGGECPGCGRVMSVREGVEQGQCNDCNGGAL